MPAHLSRKKNSNAVLYHYGNCRDPKALGMKAKKADDLYQNSSAYVGGLLAEPRSFTYAFEKIKTNRFEFSHPKYIKDWYELHKNQPTKYDAGDNDENKLWCFEEDN
jgi:hypothetical protein